jgi:hypothetical protein
VAGIHQAYSLSVGSVFQIGVVTTIAALVAALVMRELPLRTSAGHGQAPAPGPLAEEPQPPVARTPHPAPTPD